MADKTIDMNAYKQSGAYQSLGIDKLQEQLAGYQTDDAALRQQAEAQYKPTYDAELQALKNQTAQQIQGYQGQLAGMGTSYDRQRRQINEGYDQSILSASNALTRRGLGRSSLVATQGAYLEKQRNEALADINADQTAAANAINEKIALLTDQAAQNEKLMAGNYASQIENRINELREKNQSAATSLQLQIAALQQQGYEAYQNWLLQQQNHELALRDQQLAEDQFAWQKEQAAKKSGGSSGGYSAAQNLTPAPQNPSSDDLLDKLMGDMSGNALNKLSGIVNNAGSIAANAASNVGSAFSSVLGAITGNKNKTGGETGSASGTYVSDRFKQMISRK